MRLPFSIPPPGLAPFDVVGFGQNSIDLVAVVATYPPRNSKQPMRTFARQPGGQIATALAACARLGWKTRYLGSFGDDELGRLSRESLIREGVDVEASRTVPGTTNQFAIVLVDEETGDRTVLWRRDPNLAVPPAAVSNADVATGRVLIVDCLDPAAAAEAARCARRAGMATVVDVERVLPGVDRLLEHIDAIIAAEAFPGELTGHSDLGRALDAMERTFRAPLVCVTLGDGGSLARSGGKEIRTAGFRIDCVDTTGAGDAFRGGFAAACLRDPAGSLENALMYANAVAALNCRALGARGGLPTSAEVDALTAMR